MKQKIAHILKENKGSRMPDRFIFFDTETLENKYNSEYTQLSLKLGVAIYWNVENGKKETLIFKTIKEFWDFVFEKHIRDKKLFLIAHNAAFDFRVLTGFKILRGNDFKLKKFISNGTSLILEFIKKRKSIIILDNMNFFSGSLKSLGESIGFKKLEFPKNDDNALLIYCIRDVEIMVKAWENYLSFLNTNKLGNFALTIAGQSFNAYRHRFMPHKIYIHNSKRITELERAAYHGGRTECFKIGKFTGKFYCLDVNSMYPSLMLKNEYPVMLTKIYNFLKIEKLKELLKNYCLIAKVYIETKEPVFPLIKSSKLIFPIGKFYATLSTRELEYALEKNIIKKVYFCSVYEKQNLFKKYVEFFYNQRLLYKKSNNSAFSYICKLFLNSLYGKFGQKNEHYEKIKNSEIPSPIFSYLKTQNDGCFSFDLKTKIEKYKKISGQYWLSYGIQEFRDGFVAIPAHITADARMNLWQYFITAGRDNVFYCDTDSLFLNEIGYQKCIKYIGEKIGQLSLKESDKILEVRGLKDYTFAGKEVIKGIRKTAEKIKENQYKQTRFEGIKGALRQDRLDVMVIAPVIKTLTRYYSKGRIMGNGEVAPFKVNYQI